MLRLFDAAAIARALPYLELVDALAGAFADGVRAPIRHHHEIPRSHPEPATLLLMPAWRQDRDTGVKLVHVCPGNESRGLPVVQGLYVLFDGPTGTPRAVLDGTELTLRRTAAASALACRHLARSDATTLLMIGAGALAFHLVRAHAAVRPVRQVLLWNRTLERARLLAERLAAEGLAVEIVADRTAALARADIVSCATLSREPLVLGRHLRPGTHVDLVGAFRPDMRESDDELMRRARVFVDTREGALAEAGDILQAIASGALRAEDLAGDLYDLCGGRVAGRGDPAEITVFKSVGSAIEDLVAASLVLARAGP